MKDTYRRPPEETEAAQANAFADLFSTLAVSAKAEGTLASTPLVWGFEMKRGEITTPYQVQVNPCFLDEVGNPQLIIIDLDSGGVRLKQCVVLARWENGRPKIEGFESAQLEGESIQFPLTSMISMAKQAIRASYADTALERDLSLSLPPGVSNQLH